MMCMYIETFHVSIIAPNAAMIIYWILFGGMHPTEKRTICSSVVKAFAHGAMGHWIDPSRWTH